MRNFLTAAQVANGFGRSLTWFYAQRAALEARGFPAPVDGCGLRWDPAAIQDWQDAQRPARAASPDQMAEATLIGRARALIEGQFA